jgi:hypothetical protein
VNEYEEFDMWAASAPEAHLRLLESYLSSAVDLVPVEDLSEAELEELDGIVPPDIGIDVIDRPDPDDPLEKLFNMRSVEPHFES